jgi:hypothetical protein
MLPGKLFLKLCPPFWIVYRALSLEMRRVRSAAKPFRPLPSLPWQKALPDVESLPHFRHASPVDLLHDRIERPYIPRFAFEGKLPGAKDGEQREKDRNHAFHPDSLIESEIEWVDICQSKPDWRWMDRALSENLGYILSPGKGTWNSVCKERQTLRRL